jgi:beta-lactamase regulating signal transducer with metallopeptidase domain
MDELLLWIGQGTALVVLVSLTVGHSRRISASMRYRLWWMTLVLVVALPLLDTLDLPGLGAILGFAVPADPLSLDLAAVVPQPGPTPSWPTMLLVLGAGAWIVVNAVRMHVAFAHLDAAKRSCKPFPFVRERQLARWKTARNRGRRATLVLSEHVRAAGVLGLGYPRIAVNADLVSSLSDEELDQLVLHEYAHVQRRDDLAAVAQSIVRALVGWHPAVWWIDRRLRVEREVACDDWVLSTTEAPRSYARFLTRIADLSRGRESMLVPASGRRSHLTMRVTRLLDNRRNTSTRPSSFALATAALLLTVVSIGLVGRQASVVPLEPVVAERSSRPSPVPAGEVEIATPAPERQARRVSGEPRVIDAARAVLAAAVGTVEAATLPVRSRGEDPSDAGRADVTIASFETSSPAERTPAVVARTSAPVAEAIVPDETSPSDAPALLPSTDTGAASEESGWVANSGRAVATAGVVAGRSIADAGMSAGEAVADAGAAAFKGSRNAAVKTARFFTKLGKKVANPF